MDDINKKDLPQGEEIEEIEEYDEDDQHRGADRRGRRDHGL